MKQYKFRTDLTEIQRDSVVIKLRKDGYNAYRETGMLFTNADRMTMAISWGSCPVDLGFSC